MTIQLQFTKPQFRLVTTESLFPAMVAGFGSGKTEALVARAIRLKLESPECNVALYLPTYDLVNSIAIPRLTESLGVWGLTEGKQFKAVKSQFPRIDIQGANSIILRTMDTPHRIIGYEVADSVVDELDTLKHKDAEQVWRRIVSRNRQKKANGKPNTVAVGTTPEGFRFVYEKWKKNPPSKEYELIRASTYSNARNLPAGYIDNLKADYPPNLIAAYLNGEFVNLTSGAVYSNYDRAHNLSTETVKAGDNIHIGIDFNVGNMAAVVFVNRNSNPHAVDEFSKLLDTPALIRAIRVRYGFEHSIYVYPDASGGSRKSNNASMSDIMLLHEAGFNVMVDASNPAVRDRVLALNLMLAGGARGRLYVNPATCPNFVQALEQQVYDEKTGEPDKKSGLDHHADAGGYFISNRFPVVNRRVQTAVISGV